MRVKPTYFIRIWDDENPEIYGLGECNLFPGLGIDDTPEYENILRKWCRDINSVDISMLSTLAPSIAFGIETALADLHNGGIRKPFPSQWTDGRGEITINGLVWMGSIEEMTQRVAEKIDSGFHCVKLKIGGQDFNRELEILSQLRSQFPKDKLEIRLDANGAFATSEAMGKLEKLAKFDIHSIEQPIKEFQWDSMSRICKDSPIPVALDEELIYQTTERHRIRMLDTLMPQYIILKPALHGSFCGAKRWIQLAQERNIGWWITSALESNIGLNAIAQWAATLEPNIPQGLGTGGLYFNNIESPLRLTGEKLSYDNNSEWIVPELQWISCE